VAKSRVIKYCAFLSSCHCDVWWSKWLYAALEGYRIDNDLAGRKTRAGRVPKALRPVFRESEDFAADHPPSEQTLAALEASRFLIVICSPNAAKSKYVNEEIRRFKILHGANSIIPVIVGGQPGELERECLPPAVRFKIGADGVLTWEQERELIAVDARPEGAGKEVAKQKVLAALLGVGLDEIMRPVEKARQRRNSTSALLAGIFLAVAVAVTGGVTYAWWQLQTSDALLTGALKTATQMINTVVGEAEKYNVPRSATLGFLGIAERLFAGIARHGRPTKELRYRKAWMLIEFAHNYEMLGNTQYQLARAETAHRFMIGLAAEDPNNIDWQNDLSITYNEVGRVFAAQGALNEAIASFRDNLAIAGRIAAADLKNLQWQRNLSLTHFFLAGVLFEQGALDGALDNYRESLAISQRIASTDVLNTGWQGDLADIYFAIGNVLRAQGQLSNALKNYRASIVIFERLTAIYPTTTFWYTQLAYTYDEIGNMFRQQHLYKEALQIYREYLAIMKRLASTDLKNANWQKYLWEAYYKVGDMLFELGGLDEAFKNYRHSLAIIERLTATDTKNFEWQRDMSFSYLEMGHVLMELEELDEALQSYRQSLVINERLRATDANNTNIQLDLALLYKMIGEVLDKEGSQSEATRSYRNGLLITERLAIDDPSNARNLFDMLDFQSRLATLGDDSVERLTLVVKGLRKVRSEIELTPSQANWLHKAESQLEKLSQVAVFMPDPDPDPMNAMALAPAEALENVTSFPPRATAETKVAEAAPTQETTKGAGTEMQCRENITEQRGSYCTLGDRREPRAAPAVNDELVIAAVSISHHDSPAVLPSEPETPVATPDILVGSATPPEAAEVPPAPATAPSTQRSQTRSNSAQLRDRDDSHSGQRRDRHDSGSGQRRDRSTYSPPSHNYQNNYQGGYARVW
jgi:tetratricopeptide (TPR) repeat protein